MLKMTALLLLFFPVFICSFMVAAPIFGYLGDRFNRKIILSSGIFFWSFVTLLSSFITKDVSAILSSSSTNSSLNLQTRLCPEPLKGIILS